MGKLLIPPARPQLSRPEAIQLLAEHGLNVASQVVIIGIRGYYKNTFGVPGKNDVGFYDDAIIVISPQEYQTYNGNTDPSVSGRKLAMLKPGTYQFYKGKHKGQYRALRAYPEGVQLPCTRDGKDSLCSYINIHRGGYTSTWSEGCQTVPISQFGDADQMTGFIGRVYRLMNELGQKTITYLLIEQK